MCLERALPAPAALTAMTMWGLVPSHRAPALREVKVSTEKTSDPFQGCQREILRVSTCSLNSVQTIIAFDRN